MPCVSQLEHLFFFKSMALSPLFQAQVEHWRRNQYIQKSSILFCFHLGNQVHSFLSLMHDSVFLQAFMCDLSRFTNAKQALHRSTRTVWPWPNKTLKHLFNFKQCMNFPIDLTCLQGLGSIIATVYLFWVWSKTLQVSGSVFIKIDSLRIYIFILNLWFKRVKLSSKQNLSIISGIFS